MDYIIKQSKTFQSLVSKHISYKYNLDKRVFNGGHLHDSSMYEHGKCLIVPTQVVSNLFNTQFSSQFEFTCVFVMYRVLSYRKARGNTVNICRLDVETRRKILEEVRNTRCSQIDPENIVVIGRKYKCVISSEVSLDCFSVPCLTNLKLPVQKVNSPTTQLNIQLKPNITTFRRQFLMNLKRFIADKLSDQNTMYLNNILKQSLFLDIEYANDITDSFKTFPVSEDNSILFMVGFGYTLSLRKPTLEYTNLTVTQFSKVHEYEVLERLMSVFECLCKEHGDLFVFHWSNADLSVITKRMNAHPQLKERFSVLLSRKLHFIDLMQIVKQTIPLNSYSLKNVARTLLNIEYQTDCKDGFAAMMAVIELANKGDDLSVHKDMKDIVKYNKTDTELLYNILQCFCG
jgi:DNA polymerase elongation subunit (family B)